FATWMSSTPGVVGSARDARAALNFPPISVGRERKLFGWDIGHVRSFRLFRLPSSFSAQPVHRAGAPRRFMRCRGNRRVFPENACARTRISRVRAARRWHVVDEEAPEELVIALEIGDAFDLVAEIAGKLRGFAVSEILKRVQQVREQRLCCRVSTLAVAVGQAGP